MAVRTKIQQLVNDDDGIVTAYVSFVDRDTGEKLKNICVQGKTVTQIKDAVRPYLAKIKAEQAEKQTLLTTVQQALTELDQEAG